MVALTVSFDGATIAREWGWWSIGLTLSTNLARVAIATLAATLLFGGAALRAEWLRQPPEADQAHLPWVSLLAHLAAFAVFAWVTALVFGGSLHDSASPGGWVIAWFGTGVVALACWAATAISPKLWWPLVRGGSGAIAVGVAVGVAAWGLGRLVDLLWEPLSRSTLLLVQALLQLAFSNTVCRPDEFVVGTAKFQVAISP
jgi:hypothetical protein